MAKTSAPTRPRARRAPVRPRFSDRARLFLPGRTLRLQLLAAGAAIALALSAHSFASAREAGATYLIQPGDTLSRIAKSTGVPLDRLVSLNRIGNPDLILAGRPLDLGIEPNAEQRAAAESATPEYLVRAGDTLSSISARSGASVQALAELNRLQQVDRLMVGQRLKLPAGSQVKASSPGEQKTVAAPPASSALQQRVLAEARRVAGEQARIGVAARNLVTGEQVRLRADERFPSASVMKLPLLVELERQIDTGARAWSDDLRRQATAMMVVSDNAAANRIYDLVGEEQVNATLARQGLKGTKLLNHFADTRDLSASGQNQTTPSDMARLLELIATDAVVSPRASAEMRAFMLQNADRSKLVRLLPGDARVAHKSGWYEGVANDAGIVTVERSGARWAIAVFGEDIPDAETGNQAIAAISRAVYDTWSGGQ